MALYFAGALYVIKTTRVRVLDAYTLRIIVYAE
jgi:hypothetical protein